MKQILINQSGRMRNTFSSLLFVHNESAFKSTKILNGMLICKILTILLISYNSKLGNKINNNVNASKCDRNFQHVFRILHFCMQLSFVACN